MSAAPAGVVVRRARVADVAAVAALVERGNQTYREWAVPGWRAPSRDEERLRWLAKLEDRAGWAAVAAQGDRLVGCVAVTDARLDDRSGSAIPGRAHLSRLFVEPREWGRGIGGLLLGEALRAIRRRGYLEVQLFTPASNTRARRFYERHGWRSDGRARAWRGLRVVGCTLGLGEPPHPGLSGDR